MSSPSDVEASAIDRVSSLWRRVLDGDLAAGDAERSVTAGAPGELGPAAAEEIARLAGAAARGDARAGTVLARLLLRAVGVSPDAVAEVPAGRLVAPSIRSALVAWVDVCAFSLAEVGDPALLDSARQATELLLAHARDTGDAHLAAATRYGFASLLIHVYLAGRTPESVDADDARWREHSRSERALHGATEADLDRQMPPWRDALGEAVDLLEQALPALSGQDRGLAGYDLLKVLQVRSMLGDGDSEASARLREVASDTLQHLPCGTLPVQHLAVLEIAVRHGATTTRDEVEKLSRRWPDDVAHHFGDAEAFDCAWHLAALWERIDPSRALLTMRDAAELAQRLGEQSRRQALTREVTLIAIAYAPWIYSMADTLGWQAAAVAVTDRLDESGRLGDADARMADGADVAPVTSVAAALVELARRAAAHDPGLGRHLLATAKLVCPHLVARHHVALRALHALLLLGGAQQAADEQPTVAAAELGQSAQILLELDLPEAALQCVGALADLMLEHRDALGAVLDVLERIGPAVVRDCGPPGYRAIRTVVLRAFASLLGGLVDPDDVLRASAVLKGPRFAAALRDVAAIRARLSAVEPDDLVREIGELQAQLGTDLAVDEDASDQELFFERALLTSYLDDPIATGGSTPMQRLANLQRLYDRRLTDLVFGDPTAYRPVLSPDIAAALPDSTVLLDLTAAAVPEGRLGLYTQAFPARGPYFFNVVASDMPYADYYLVHADQRQRFGPLGPQVQHAREEIGTDPGRGRAISRSGAERLERDALDFLGARGLAFLDELRKDGYQHLMVVPNGPLHFYPWHLLTHGGRTLGDDWIVTVLPNRELLFYQPGQPRLAVPRTRQLTALGMGFAADTRPGLTPLPGSVDEARDIARLFGATLLADAECTEETARMAFVESRWLHLSTHGRHNVAAPSLQCLYVTPTATTPGRLTAADILRLDLRGLDLVTMSACETALGRFDDGDNLRGLPGALLLAGARTIVGTLWPVRPDVTRTFFLELYTGLREGAPKLTAFQRARGHTRTRHPQHRDWGAFIYLGAP